MGFDQDQFNVNRRQRIMEKAAEESAMAMRQMTGKESVEQLKKLSVGELMRLTLDQLNVNNQRRIKESQEQFWSIWSQGQSWP